MHTSGRIDEIALLEAGLLAAGVAIAGAAIVLGGGRIAEEVGRVRRHRGPGPTRGSVPADRHRHVGTAAAR